MQYLKTKIAIFSLWILLFCALIYGFYGATTSFQVNFFERRLGIYWFLFLFGILSFLLECRFYKKFKNLTITYFLCVFFGYIIVHFGTASFVAITQIDKFFSNLRDFDYIVYFGFLFFGTSAIFGLYCYFTNRYKLALVSFAVCILYYIFEIFIASSHAIFWQAQVLLFNYRCGKCPI